MAFNIQTFKTRTLTAIVFAVVMLLGLFVNHWLFFCLFTIIHFGCWLEYQKLISLIDSSYKTISVFHKYGVIITGFGFMLWMLNASYSICSFKLHLLGMSLVIIFAIVLPISEILFSQKQETKPAFLSFLGLLYISLSLGLMLDLYEVTIQKIKFGNSTFAIFTIVCMWVNDTMAYIVGSFIGKTPFSKISPKKTWEGTIGGIVLCTIVMGLAMNFIMVDIETNTPYSFLKIHWFVMAAIAAITGTFGDLLESKIKRLANVKDSGNFMPGHGGFLDRFDSLLLATPFIWLYIKLIL